MLAVRLWPCCFFCFVFQEKEIRRIWHNDEWWFAVVDVIAVLTESKDTRQYVKRMRSRDKELNRNWGTICTPLEMLAKDGKNRKMNASNTEGLFRIIQSIPSPKAEPFKQWLAKVGYERIQEIENPELAAERARRYYQELGYSDDWIAKRLQSIEIRGKLTDEWRTRGVKKGIEYSILTAEISTATFGLSPAEYKLKSYAFAKYTLLFAKAVGFNPPCLIEFRRLFI